MNLENFTDLQTWAVEQWGDAKLGDSRRTQRAMPAAGYAYAIGAAIAANSQGSLPFFAIVSVRLLQLRQLSRSNPQLLAHEYIPSIMLKVLVARLGLTNCELTLGEFFLAIARLGGFLGRKSDGLSGWQTLWRGWLRLQDMCWAADFITQSL